MDNEVWENGRCKSNKQITDKDEAFYLDSVPNKALAPNWSDYI